MSEEQLSTGKMLTMAGVIIFAVFGWLGNKIVETQAELRSAIHAGSTRMAIIENRLDHLEEKGSDQ